MEPTMTILGILVLLYCVGDIPSRVIRAYRNSCMGGALASFGSGGFPSLGGDILVGLDTLLNLLVDIYLVLSELLSGFLSPLDPF